MDIEEKGEVVLMVEFNINKEVLDGKTMLIFFFCRL